MTWLRPLQGFGGSGPSPPGSGGLSPLLWGAGSVGTTTTTRWLYPGYSDDLAQTVAIEFEVGEAGTISLLRVVHNVPATSAVDVTYTLFKNGVATALTVTAAANSAGGVNLGSSVAVVAGDKLSLRVTKAGALGSPPLEDVTATAKYAA